VHLEHFEPRDVTQYSEHSRHEYGNRVGLFRIMEAMDHAGARGTAALDIHTAATRPFVVDQVRAAHWELIAHGLIGNRPIPSEISDSAERDYIGRTLRSFEVCTGTSPIGWLSDDFGESVSTPRLLAEFGIRYLFDWPNDEQPYSMTVPKGTLTALPMLLDLDDAVAMERRGLETSEWLQAVEEAASRMASDAATGARLLVLGIHPWILGQPHRIRYFDKLLGRLQSSGVWFATGSEIVAAFEASEVTDTTNKQLIQET
jgi:hypothetical protein